MWKKIFYHLLIVLILLSISGCSNINKKETIAPTKQHFVNIATGNADSTVHKIGIMLAQMCNKEIQGMNTSTLQVPNSQLTNVELLVREKAGIAFLRSDVAFYAANGLELFDGKKADKLKGVISLYSETIQIVTLDKTRIKKIEDIKGRRLMIIGSKDGFEQINARQILKAYAIDLADVRLQYATLPEAVQHLLQGGTDVLFAMTVCPDDSLHELSVAEQTVFLPIDYQKLTILLQENTYYVKDTIVKSTYFRQPIDVTSLSVHTILAVNDKINDDMGYKIAKTIYNNYDSFKNPWISKHMKAKKPEMESLGLSMNEGSRKFLNE